MKSPPGPCPRKSFSRQRLKPLTADSGPGRTWGGVIRCSNELDLVTAKDQNTKANGMGMCTSADVESDC